MNLGIRVGWALCLLNVGCATAPPLNNPVLLQASAGGIENPVLVSPGVPTAAAYREVFEKTADVLGDYFDLLPPNPYEGKIVTKPRIAPGYEQFWRPGNPDARGRLLATFQTIRQTATAEIRAGERGGYLVYVVVEKELEDVSKPTQARVGSAIFQEAATVSRDLDVVVPDIGGDPSWFRVGRNYALEQQILARIRNGH